MGEVDSKKYRYEVSVKSLVEFSVNSGDLFYQFRKSPTAIEGQRVHSMLQKSRLDGYHSEYFIKDEIEFSDYVLLVRGRLDGVFTDRHPIVIEEIKTTYYELEQIPEAIQLLHLAQAKVYACLYAREKKTTEISIQMTYFNLSNNQITYKNYSYALSDLEDFYLLVIEFYINWQNRMHQWIIDRNKSLLNLKFPFDNFRKGQRQLSIDTYRSIRDNKRIYIQAPTGIGKTLGVLYPALKNMGETSGDRIFFLTAKTIGKKVVEDTVSHFKGDARIKTITLTAKDKICFATDGQSCNPTLCVYTKNYYEKLRLALAEFWNYQLFDKSTIEDIAKKYEICPFELSLDLANWCDLIICDFNYVFDPFVYLRRFFDENLAKNSIVLIDEANHLAERARQMYSAEISRYPAIFLPDQLTGSFTVFVPLLQKIDKAFKSLFKRIKSEKWQMNACVLNEIPKGMSASLEAFQSQIEEFLLGENIENIPSELMNYYFEINRFLKIKEYFNERYRFIFKNEDNRYSVKLFCLDASEYIKLRLDSLKVAVLFSATLSPFSYFSKTIEGHEEIDFFTYDSPFDPSHQQFLLNTKVSTFYEERASYYDQVVDDILKFVSEIEGNYLCFLPSFTYLEAIAEKLLSKNEIKNLIIQNRNMNEDERGKFLQQFHSNQPVTGLAVLGGLFSEGIDLAGEKLIGVIVVGVGMPSPSAETDLLKEYYQKVWGEGFQYAYLLPGFHKVQQAVGRLIRSETDKGRILLIDKRYREIRYQRLYPRHWEIPKF